MTLSSHGSLFTGLYPSWHGAHLTRLTDPRPLDPSFHTLAETLSENGYTTMAVLANSAYLRPQFGMNQGFDLYDVRNHVNGNAGGGYFWDRRWATSVFLRDVVRAALEHFVSTAELDRLYRRADQITNDGLRILGAMRGRTEPFFLNLNYMDAHEPYIPPAPFRDRFPGRDPWFKNNRVYAMQRELALVSQSRTPTSDLAHIVSQYDGAIAFMDTEIQRLLVGMKQAGLYDNTLIVIISDHGEGLGEHRILGHPAAVYQTMVHVPLLVKYPRASAQPPGRQIDTPVSGVDVMPTVLEVAGIGIPANLQGQSLRKLSGDTPELVVSESFPDRLSRLRGRSDSAQRAIYQGPWKFISTAEQKELYNLSLDPGEMQNLYDSKDPLARRLTEELDEWIQEIPRRRTPAESLDRETMERLRSLGYIQ